MSSYKKKISVHDDDKYVNGLQTKDHILHFILSENE